MAYAPRPDVMNDCNDAPPPLRAALWRWWPVVALAAAGLAIHVTGFGRHFSLEEVARNRDVLRGFVEAHWLLAMLAYAALYIGIILASLPVAAVLSIAGGFLFGWWVSAPLSVVAATIGATIVFRIIRGTAGHSLAARVGRRAARFQRGFRADAFHYLLAMRLMPVVPFCVVNGVAGLCGVKTRTFVTATLLGIIPGALAYAWLGSGLDSVILAQRQAYAACMTREGPANCSFSLDPSALLTPQIVAAFAALALVALLPLLLKRLRKRMAL